MYDRRKLNFRLSRKHNAYEYILYEKKESKYILCDVTHKQTNKKVLQINVLQNCVMFAHGLVLYQLED